MRTLFFILALLTVNTIELPAQKIKNYGLPYIRNYSPEEYDAWEQNWAIHQDRRGVMYFGNNTGILEFDGNSWRRIPLPNNRVVRSFGEDATGRIYVGGQNELGYLYNDSASHLKYRSLLEKIPSGERNFTDITAIYCLNERMVFHSFFKLLILEKDTFRIIKPSDRFHLSFLVGGKLYLREWKKGLLTLEEKDLVPVPGSEIFAEERIYAMLPFSDQQILIATRSKGLYLYDGKKFERWKTPIDDFLRQNQINYSYAVLDDNYFALGTIMNGIVILDKSGKPVQWLNKKRGLRDNWINSLYVDRRGNLWAALNNGLSYIEIHSPFTYVDDRLGIETKCLTATILDSILYIGGSPNLYSHHLLGYHDPFHPKPFVIIDMPGKQTNYLLKKQNEVFCTNAWKVYQIHQNKATPIVTDGEYRPWTLTPMRGDPNLILVAENGGLFIIQKKNGHWVFRNKIRGFNFYGRYVASDDQGFFWTGEAGKKVIQFRLNDNYDSVIYVKTYNLPIEHFPFYLDHQIIALTKELFYVYNAKKDTFEPDSVFNNLIGSNNNLLLAGINDTTGDIWFYNNDHLGWLKKRKGGTYTLIQSPFLKLDKSITGYTVHTFNDSTVLINRHLGFIHYDPTFPAKEDCTFITMIRCVSLLLNDSVLFGGTVFSPGKIPILRLDYPNNSLRFEFSAPFFENPEKTQYRWILEGYDKDWSSWSGETKKDYTQLPQGDYRFRVIARNVFLREGKEDVIRIIIFPPWYRTVWAYMGYLILAVFMVYGLVYVNIRRVKSSNRRLQEKIEQRTRELRESNEQLKDALSKVKTLSGLLPICANCKKIRDDHGYWNQIEKYITDHSHAEFSHGICPECQRRLYPELFRDGEDQQ